MHLDKEWMVLLSQQNQMSALAGTNWTTEKYGLVLSEEDAGLILKERQNSLREQEE